MSRAKHALAGRDVAVYSTPWCPDCTRLRRYFEQAGVRFREVDIDADEGAAERLERETGKLGVPYVLIDGATWVRGYHKELASRFQPDLFWSEVQVALG